MFETILLAVDGSDHAARAAQVAADLSKRYGAVLHLCFVPPYDVPVIGSPLAGRDGPAALRSEADEIAERVTSETREGLRRAGVPDSKVHMPQGNPASEILALAERLGADLVVLGRRGLGSLGGLALGSVSQAVTQRAKMACLTVP